MASSEKSLLARLNISYAALAALGVFLLGLLLLMALAFFKKAPWSDVIGHLAAVLIATGIIGVIYEVSLRRIFFKEVSAELQSQLNPLSNLLRMRLSGAGINVHPNLVDQNPAQLFDRASSRIRILQTWMGNYIEIESSLKAAATRGCKVEILLLNPKSPLAEARSRDLGEPEDYVGRGIVSNIERLIGLCKRNLELASNIKLVLYDATPIMTLYWYDETCYLGLYWREGNAIAKPQLEIDIRYSYFGEEVENHFSSLWNDKQSRTIDLSKPMLTNF
jgi:uncharacterized protein DUF5919